MRGVAPGRVSLGNVSNYTKEFKDFKCPVCGRQKTIKVKHGKSFVCYGCNIQFVTHGNDLSAYMDSIFNAKSKHKKKATWLAIKKEEDYIDWGVEDKENAAAVEMLRKGAPVDVIAAVSVLNRMERTQTAATAKPVDITGLASELDKRAVKNAADEIKYLKLRIQSAQTELAKLKAENAKAEKRLSVEKGESQEEPDEMLKRFSFVLDDE